MSKENLEEKLKDTYATREEVEDYIGKNIAEAAGDLLDNYAAKVDGSFEDDTLTVTLKNANSDALTNGTTTVTIPLSNYATNDKVAVVETSIETINSNIVSLQESTSTNAEAIESLTSRVAINENLLGGLGEHNEPGAEGEPSTSKPNTVVDYINSRLGVLERDEDDGEGGIKKVAKTVQEYVDSIDVTNQLGNYYTKEETYSRTEVDAAINDLDNYYTKT